MSEKYHLERVAAQAASRWAAVVQSSKQTRRLRHTQGLFLSEKGRRDTMGVISLWRILGKRQGKMVVRAHVRAVQHWASGYYLRWSRDASRERTERSALAKGLGFLYRPLSLEASTRLSAQETEDNKVGARRSRDAAKAKIWELLFWRCHPTTRLSPGRGTRDGHGGLVTLDDVRIRHGEWLLLAGARFYEARHLKSGLMTWLRRKSRDQ